MLSELGIDCLQGLFGVAFNKVFSEVLKILEIFHPSEDSGACTRGLFMLCFEGSFS